MDAFERHQRLLAVPGVVLPIYTVYAHPRDFPQHYVVRPCVVDRHENITNARVAGLYDTLDEAMLECEELGLAFLAAFEQDDPTIVGTFL